LKKPGSAPLPSGRVHFDENEADSALERKASTNAQAKPDSSKPSRAQTSKPPRAPAASSTMSPQLLAALAEAERDFKLPTVKDDPDDAYHKGSKELENLRAWRDNNTKPRRNIAD